MIWLAIALSIRDKRAEWPTRPERIMSEFAAQRRTMVDCQLRTFDVFDRALLAAVDEIPRELFVPPAMRALAYGDQIVSLPSTRDDPRGMLAPMVLGRLIQALEIESRDRVLDVGSGLGYASAILARLGATVTALESNGDLAKASEEALREARIEGVTSVVAPLQTGAPKEAPFNAILINGTVEERPSALLDQLADGGRLACLTRKGGAGKAILYVRSGKAFSERPLFDASAPVLSAFQRPASFQF